jgi:hypothetical protein
MKFYPIVFVIGILTMLLSVTAASWKGTAPAKIAIIVNQANPVTSLKSQEVRSFYLTTRLQTWPGTKQVAQAVCRQNACIENELFCARVLHMPAEDVEKYRFSKHHSPAGSIRSFATDNELIDYIAQTPGAIGYVNCKH